MIQKKIIATVLAAVLLLTAAGCQEQEQPGSVSKTDITIPAVTVDLQAPENRVEVPQDVPSQVYDEAGNLLTGKQWLLNSKFAKSYIQSLGVGEYTYRYESATQTGTITLTVTDSQAPGYLFDGTLPQTVTYLESVTLPKLVKDQDSYQDSCEVTYALTKGEEAVALADDFQTPALTDGSYTWTASVTKDGKAHAFTQSFTVQTFQEYLVTMENELLLDVQKDAYLAAENGSYAVDTSANTTDFFYKLNPDVVSTAMTAGMTKVTFTVITDEALIYGKNGSIWLSNDWHGYAFAVEGARPFRTDRSSKAWPTRFTNSMTIRDGKYIYKGTVFLDPNTFTEAQPVTLQFNYAQCTAQVSVEFH